MQVSQLDQIVFFGWKVGEAKMSDREKVINDLQRQIEELEERLTIVLEGQKEIKLHKKHVITWKRDDEFTMKKLYEAICETLLDEGELFISRIDDHEKVDFTFYVTI